jgi:hypothetical protein
VLQERPPPGREGAHRVSGDADDLRHPLDRLRPLEPEAAGEFEAKLSLVEVPGSETVCPQEAVAVERPPLPVRAPGEVRNDDVRVEVRILGAARPVPEGGADKAARPLADRPALAAAGDAGLALEVAKCRAPGRLVRLGDRLARLLILCERVEEANALGAGEDEVKAGNGREPLLLVDELPRLRVDPLDRDCPVPDRRSQPVAARRVEAAKKRAELAVVDDASDPKRLSPPRPA